MHRVTINVPETLYLQLDERARENGHSLQEELLLLMRQAYSQREPAPKKPKPKTSKRAIRPLETLRKRLAGSKKKKTKAAKTTTLGDLVRTIGRERKTRMKKLLKRIGRRA